MKTITVLLFILLLFLAANNCFALQNKTIDDTSNVELRKPSREAIDKFRSDRDFIYDKAKEPVGFWEIISAWISDLLEQIFTSKAFSFISRYLTYIIIAIAVVIVIYVLHKSKLQGIIYGTQENTAIEIKETGEDIHSINFDTIINNAIANKEYRIAVRYYYLKTLKLLADNNLIDWKINKTNSQYVREIKRQELRNSFAELTHIFEWIWYGEIAVENSLFESAQKSFTSFSASMEVKA